MSINPVVDRRSALVAGLAGAGALTLAACSSSSTSAPASPTTAASSPSTATPTTSSSAQSQSQSQSQSAKVPSSTTSSPSAGAKAIAELSSIPVGQSIDATLDGKDVLVSRPTATTAACFSSVCTHQGCTVKAAGKTMDCPCHGSVFDSKTGAVVSGPAPAPLAKIAVQVVGGTIVPVSSTA